MDDYPHDENEQNKLTPRISNTASHPNTTVSSGLDPSIIRHFFEMTKRELDLKEEEIAVKREAQANAHEYAKLALTAQTEHLQDGRKHKQNKRRDRMSFALIGVVLLAAFILITLKMGYDKIALEIVKDLGLMIGGATGGYLYKASKNSDKEEGAAES